MRELRTETEELETQKQIYLLVSKHPGLNLSTIAEMLRISLPLALYHLRYLEKHNLVSFTKEDGFQRYYLKGEVGVQDKLFLSLFRQEVLLKIVLVLLKTPYTRHKDLLEYFEMSPPLLSYHLKKLVKKGIIAVQGSGQERGYFVVNEGEVITFLIKYEPYKILGGISETWTNFTIR
jgi:predicted transcriptional regulator